MSKTLPGAVPGPPGGSGGGAGREAPPERGVGEFVHFVPGDTGFLADRQSVSVHVGYSGRFIKDPTQGEHDMQSWLDENAEQMRLWARGDDGYSAGVTPDAQHWLQAVPQTL